MKALARRGAWLALLLAAVAGCDRLEKLKPRNDPGEDAAAKVRAGDYRAAVALYERDLDGTEATAMAHYEIALLYEGPLKEPLGAVHHFRRYLELAPAGRHVREAKRLLAEAEDRLRAELHDGATVSQKEAVRLKNEVLALQKRIDELRDRKPEGRAAQGRAPTAQEMEARRKPVPPGARQHVVEPGETLAAISRRYFKTSARWKDIQDANFNALSGTATIRPGQTLIIPE
jgi:hypothetical protein